MTKQEFQTAFNTAYKTTLDCTASTIASDLKKYTDGNDKISIEDLSGAILLESFKMNATFLKQLLEDVLELSD
nr:MAG TPA: hypothetical protein [Caudoviricetes sp.]